MAAKAIQRYIETLITYHGTWSQMRTESSTLTQIATTIPFRNRSNQTNYGTLFNIFAWRVEIILLLFHCQFSVLICYTLFSSRKSVKVGKLIQYHL